MCVKSFLHYRTNSLSKILKHFEIVVRSKDLRYCWGGTWGGKIVAVVVAFHQSQVSVFSMGPSACVYKLVTATNCLHGSLVCCNNSINNTDLMGIPSEGNVPQMYIISALEVCHFSVCVWLMDLKRIKIVTEVSKDYFHVIDNLLCPSAHSLILFSPVNGGVEINLDFEKRFSVKKWESRSREYLWP